MHVYSMCNLALWSHSYNFMTYSIGAARVSVVPIATDLYISGNTGGEWKFGGRGMEVGGRGLNHQIKFCQ